MLVFCSTMQSKGFTTLGTGRTNKTDCVCDIGYVYDTQYVLDITTIDLAKGGETCKVWSLLWYCRSYALHVSHHPCVCGQCWVRCFCA
jgi:hypothetical protein